MKLVIPFTLPGLNEYIERSGHTGRRGGAQAQVQRDIAAVLRRQVKGPLREPVWMRYTWIEKDRRPGQG